MKKILISIFLSAMCLYPVSTIAAQTNSHRQQNKTENSSRGKGNSGRPGNNRGGNNKNDHNKNHKNDHNKHDKGHDKGHNNGNGKPGGNSYNRPGGNHHNPQPPKPHGPKPGHRPGSSISAPGHPGHAYGRHHHPHLGKMVKHCVGRGRYDHVWMVAPGQYAVRFFRNGYYYMQYIWPETGRYGTPFRIVMSAPGQWYAYNNRNQWYYDDGNSLRISLNGSPMTPWTLVPNIELNINL